MGFTKASAISRELADRLSKRFSALTVTESIGTAGDPIIFAGTGVAGTPNFLIRVTAVDQSIMTDALGLAAVNYTPHMIQFVTEQAAGGANTYILTTVQLLDLIGEVVAMKPQRIEWYAEANGAAITEADITGAKLATTFVPSMYWPATGQ